MSSSATLSATLKGQPELRRYLRRTSTGLLRIDQSAIKEESHLDGKWLLRTSDPTVSAQDRAAAYKHLLGGLVVTRHRHAQSACIRVITAQTPDSCAHQLRNSGQWCTGFVHRP